MDEHIPAWCMISGCKEEASYWVAFEERPTFYLCSDHAIEIADDDFEYPVLDPVTREIKKVEIGGYCCSCECDVCHG